MKRKLLIILITITFNALSQKPKKIFSSLQEGNLIEAQLEYNKISSDNKYNEKEIILFEIANSLLMIEPTSTSYNPIESIINFNKIFVPAEKKEDIIKFLEKFELDLDKISERIHSEIVFQAKSLNTVESYSNALKVCADNYRLELSQLKEEASYYKTIQEASINSYKSFILNYNQSYHKVEIQSLLERKVLNTAKNNQSISELNSFIKEYSNSKLNQEAADFRDSIVLSKVPNEYDAMFEFTKEYPNSKFTNEINLQLPNLLYNEVVKSDFNYEKCKKFITKYPYNKIVNIIDSVFFNKTLLIDSISRYHDYLELMSNGSYKTLALKKIDAKTLSIEKIINCYNLDTLNLFLKCENILNHSKIYLYQVCLAISLKKLKENVILKNVKNENLSEKLFKCNYEFINNDIDYDINNESEKIIIEIIKCSDILVFFESNTFKDSIQIIEQLWLEFTPYFDELRSGFDFGIIGNGFITLTTSFGTGSSINSTLYLVKNNYLFDVDITNFEFELNKYLIDKYPYKNCYSEIGHTTYKFNKSTNELILTGGLICNQDPRCCPSYQFKVITSVLNNKMLVKSISSTKTTNY